MCVNCRFENFVRNQSSLILNKVFWDETCPEELYQFVAVVCFIEFHDFYLFLTAVYFWLGCFIISGMVKKSLLSSINELTYKYLIE